MDGENMEDIFFAESKTKGIDRINYLSKTDRFYHNKTIKLSKQQIDHISGWKTYTIIKK